MHILIQMVAFLLNLKIRLKEMKVRFPIQLTLGQIKTVLGMIYLLIQQMVKLSQTHRSHL